MYADVNGAHNVGMFPVLYEGSTAEEDPFANQNNNTEIYFEHLHIHHWKEMIEILETLK